MKYSIIKIQILIFAFVAVLFSSCKEEENVVAPVFPSEVKTFNVLPGEEVELEFDANMEWKLFSSAVWCRFSNQQLAINGNAGSQKVKLSVNSDAWSIEEGSANISLSMGGQEEIIAQLVRGAKGLEMKDANGNAYGTENAVSMAYTVNGINGKFSFTGNFDWELSASPEWLEIVEGLPVKAGAGQTVELNLKVVKKYWVSAGEGNLVFNVQGTEQTVTVPVKYDGITEGKIETDGINGAYWWNISKDGSQYWKEGSDFTDEVEPTDFPLNFGVIARDNKYAVVKIEQSGKFMNVDDEYSSFITVENDGQGNVSINSVAENTGAERIAYVVAMPQNVYDEMIAKVEESGWVYDGILLTGDGSDIAPEYEQYVAIAFKQEGEAVSAGGFNIMMNAMTPLEAVPGDGGTGYSGFISSEYGVSEDQIYSVSAPLESYLLVDPMLPQEEWMGDVVAIDFEGSPVGPENFEPGMNESGRYTVSFSLSKSMIIIFRGTDMANRKALFVLGQ